MKKLFILLLLSTSFSTFAFYKLDFSVSDFCYQQPNVQDRSGVSDLYWSNRFHVKHDGIYYFPNEEDGITATSLCFFKDGYGQYDSKGKLKKGLKVGKWTHWHPNGQKWVEAYWKDGKKDGTWLVWHNKGQKQYEENWKNDEKEGKWTWWDLDGQIELEGNFKNGKASGRWTWWKSDGSVLKKGAFNADGYIKECLDSNDEVVKNEIDGGGGLYTLDCKIFTGRRDNFNMNE